MSTNAFHALVDDAAVFPPGNAELTDAVRRHAAVRGSAAGDLVGPFIAKATDLPRLAQLATAELFPDGLDVSVVLGSSTMAEVVQRDADNLRVVAVEATSRASLERGAGGELPEVFLEVPLVGDTAPTDWAEVVADLAAEGLLLKLRTGGLSADAFPDARQLAVAISAAVAAGVPFKCTAGLHHALPYDDPETGGGHHGFLNVLLATADAQRGAGADELVRRLDKRDGQELAAAWTALGPEDQARTRSSFLSFGSCSIDDPLDDLVDLGLVANISRPTPAKASDAKTGACWVAGASGSGWDVDHLPYGVFSTPTLGARVGVRVGDQVLDLHAAARADSMPFADVLNASSLNPFMDAGPRTWHDVRTWLVRQLTSAAKQKEWSGHLVRVDEVTMHLPFEVGDYVDFYASEHHATNVGRIFRPDAEPLLPNWKHLPVGYHGRSGTVVVSGTPITRPHGQRRGTDPAQPDFGPSVRLDIEAELGFVVGTATELGQRVSPADFAQHVFGVVGLNDWSARDIQAWEYVPLGPFLGKSFATTISAWVTPLAALEDARVPLPGQDPQPLPYLAGGDWAGLDIDYEVEINGAVLSTPRFRTMYWSGAQMLAHTTVNGASLRVGDLYGSGTISGPERDERGSLLELSWGGAEPWQSATGPRSFLEDDDEVVLRLSAPGQRGRLTLGEVRGRIVPAV